MRVLKERVAYLQGLTEGLEVRDQSKEGRVINSVIEVLGDVVDSLDELWDAHRQLESYTETIDEGLSFLEGEDFEKKGISEDDPHIEVACPRCHDMVCFSADIVEDDDVIEVTCPTCDEVVYVNDGSFDHRHSIMGEESEGQDHQVTQDI